MPMAASTEIEPAHGIAKNPSIYYFANQHPINESMLREPPGGFRFSSNVDPSVFDEYYMPPVYMPSRKLVTNLAKGIFQIARIPRMIPLNPKCDLLHVDGCDVPITAKPWIISNIEYSGAFFSFDDNWYNRPFSTKILKLALSSRKCRRILALSQASLDTIRLGLGRDYRSIQDKTGVLYPAVPSGVVSKGKNKRLSDDTIRILFVGNHFFDKGGRETFRAFLRIRKRYDAELVLVTSVPPHHKEYFEAYEKKIEAEPGVRMYSNVQRSFLWNECFMKSHIFCFPSYMDTLGYVSLEAMASNLAVIASDAFAFPEIIENGKSGLLVHAPFTSFKRTILRSQESLREYRAAVLDERNFDSVVDALETSLSRLIEDGPLRRRLSASALYEVSEGRFSVKTRNCQLTKIYREALE